jgi:hypothetical protein
MTVMGSREDQVGSIEALRSLLDRLCAPDLTLAEAKSLRDRVSELIERIEKSDRAA